MSTPSITDLKTTWSRRDYSTNSASPAAIDLLADGKPATPEALAKATGWSMDKVTTYIEFADRDDVVFFPLSEAFDVFRGEADNLLAYD